VKGPRTWIALGALNALLAVACGAAGAHAVDPASAGTWGKAVDYQLAHALGLLLIGVLAGQWPRPRLLHWAGGLLLAGIVLFSGSLYALVLTGLRPLAMVTPFGGSAFLLGWLLLAIAAWRG
jgi:uncharacterized membrane protein YgdD (TMEM256/DUF423 family)